jgi:hypothetical protein
MTVWPVVRDVLLLLGGLLGIGYQTVTGKVDIALLIAFLAMTGLPGLTNLVALLRGGSGGASPSSPSVSPELPSGSSSESPS